jgi:hypothetical protein
LKPRRLSGIKIWRQARRLSYVMKMSREGREGGEGFFMDKNFDRNKINL